MRKNVNGWESLTVFTKRSILDVWQSTDYASPLWTVYFEKFERLLTWRKSDVSTELFTLKPYAKYSMWSGKLIKECEQANFHII